MLIELNDIKKINAFVDSFIFKVANGSNSLI